MRGDEVRRSGGELAGSDALAVPDASIAPNTPDASIAPEAPVGRTRDKHPLAMGMLRAFVRIVAIVLGAIVAVPRWIVRRVFQLDHPLMREDAFRTFWLSRLAGQTAQGTLLYALLIVIIDRTDDPIYGSVFVACSIVPSLLFGLIGGLIVDAVPTRGLMISLNAIRGLIVFALVGTNPSLTLIFAVTVGIWTVHQFYNPAEGTAPTALVPASGFADAQSLSNLALTLSQLVGLVTAGPLLLRLASPSVLFAFCGSLYLAAGLLAAALPPLPRPAQVSTAAVVSGPLLAGVRQRVTAGWRFVQSKPAVIKAMGDDVLVGVGLSALVVIAPFYLERVLGTSKENTVFVFAPAALGLVVGLRLAPSFGRLVGLQATVTGALVLFALAIGALGFVDQLRHSIQAAGISIDGMADMLNVSSVVLVTMGISLPAGLASAVVGVSARAILLRQTPATERGKVVATQNVVGNLGALVPTLLAGAMANWLGVRAIAVAIALVILLGAVTLHRFARSVAAEQTSGTVAPGR